MGFGIALLVSPYLALLGSACLYHAQSNQQDEGLHVYLKPRTIAPLGKTVLHNVRVFTGAEMSPPQTVVIDGERIAESTDTEDADNTIDASGFLIPGLIDSHLHLNSVADLDKLTSYGITTALQMACRNYTVCDSLRGHKGLADFYTAGITATPPNSSASPIMEPPPEQIFYPNSSAVEFVHNAFGNMSDYFKITVKRHGPPLVKQIELVKATHALGKQTMSHASDIASYLQAIESCTDGVQHTPDDGNLTLSAIRQLKRNHQYVTPTMSIFERAFHDPLVMLFLRGTTDPGNSSFANVRANVATMYQHGVPILAGSDAVGKIGEDITYEHGISLHNELKLLTEAGLSAADAINAATRVPAQWHRLRDRGIIQPGKRADLVLLNANPLDDIGNTLDINRIWAGGREYRGIERLNKL